MNKLKSYKARFNKMTGNQLVDAFNREVGNSGWVASRAVYLSDMREEFIKRGIDCSVIGGKSGFSYKSRIKLNDNNKTKIVELCF